MFPDAFREHNDCNCRDCQEERLMRSGLGVVIPKSVFMNLLGEKYALEQIVCLAIVNRYWDSLNTSTGLNAMLNFAQRVSNLDIFYDSEKQRFYTINRLYI